MSKYIGATVVNLSVDTVDVTGDITATDATPEVIIVNDTHEDTDGGREGKVTFKGQQSGGEETTLAEIQASHDGTSDDEKGDLIFKTNDGSDGASPTERMRIDSAGQITLTGNIANTSGDFTLDVAGNIILDADGGTLKFKDDGTHIANIGNSSSDLVIENKVQDKDIKFMGDDGGSGVTALTLDMSDAGTAIFNNKVGIGQNSPATKLDVDGGANSDHATFSGTAGRGLKISTATGGAADEVVDFDAQASGTTQALTFSTGGTERVRVDGSGRLLVGKTVTTFSVSGIRLDTTGNTEIIRSGGVPLSVNRTSDDGKAIRVYKDGTEVGSLGSINGAYLFIGDSGGVGASFISDRIRPSSDGADADDTYDFGHPTVRWDDIYATNSSIQTSDETEKQNIASLTSAEITAATAISKLFKTYKWKSKVTAKGDNARTHTGVVAQQIQTAMSDAGLDAGNYAFFISSTWWEKDVEVAAVEANEEKGIEAKDAYTRTDIYDTKDEAPEGATEHTRMGIRYAELLSFIGAATEQRLTSIESRLTALEGE